MLICGITCGSVGPRCQKLTVGMPMCDAVFLFGGIVFAVGAIFFLYVLILEEVQEYRYRKRWPIPKDRS